MKPYLFIMALSMLYATNIHSMNSSIQHRTMDEIEREKDPHSYSILEKLKYHIEQKEIHNFKKTIDENPDIDYTMLLTLNYPSLKHFVTPEYAPLPFQILNLPFNHYDKEIHLGMLDYLLENQPKLTGAIDMLGRSLMSYVKDLEQLRLILKYNPPRRNSQHTESLKEEFKRIQNQFIDNFNPDAPEAEENKIAAEKKVKEINTMILLLEEYDHQ